MTTKKVEYFLDLILPGLPKTTNGKRQFGHWAQYHREAIRWKRNILAYLNSKKPPNPLQKARLILIRGSSTEPDYDGLVSSFKHLIDGLVEADILADDRTENIGRPDYRWEKAPRGKGFVRVIVKEF